MTAPSILKTASGRDIAYHFTAGKGPGVVFCGGYKSDMNGTKAVALEEWARRTGRAFLRFDYSGHGASSGEFADGSIGEWAEDARAAITELTDGPQIIVGSSMGGWISLLIARDMPEKVCGLVGIAAAPDFTEDSFWAGFTDAQRETIMAEGQVALPSDYPEPYIVTKKLIVDGRDQLVLRTPLDLPFPTRFLLGTADTSVKVSVATRLLEHVSGDDIRLTLVKGADHSFSTPDCLTLVEKSIEKILQRIGGDHA